MTDYSPKYTSVQYVQAKSGLTQKEFDFGNDYNIRATIEDAESEIELVTGRMFTSGNSVTDFISFKRRDILDNQRTNFRLQNYPVQSVTQMLSLNSDGTTAKTYTTLTAAQVTAGTFQNTDFWLETSFDELSRATMGNGRVILKSDAFDQSTAKIQITYTYGYAAVPVVVRDLATCLAAIRVWIQFMGGSYNRLNEYEIPQQYANKGNFYSRAKDNIAVLTKEAERLYERIGKRPRILLQSSGDNI